MPAPLPTTPFELLGGAKAVSALVERFYDRMGTHEPALARLHEIDADGHVVRSVRERFALFLIGWLGGPQDYIAAHGHPRLRMRHSAVPVDVGMRDAWVRCMQAALDAEAVSGPIRAFLDERFAEVATFLRNQP